MKCCLCRRDRSEDTMHHLVLTAEERAFTLAQQGVETADIWYCRPCYRVLADREQGAQLIRGTLLVNLRAAGVRDPEKYAQAVYERLLTKASKTPVS